MTTDFTHGGNVFAVARMMGIAPEEIIDFSASINPLGMAPGVKEAVIAALESSLHYPDSDATSLRLELARYHGVSAANTAVANGSTELIYLIPRLLSGRRGLIIAPPFAEYAAALERDGWEIGYLETDPEKDFLLSFEVLAERLAEGWDALFLCNPGNPTGKLLTCAEIARILRLCRDAGTFLVLDEAFMDFCEEESAKHLLAGEGGGVVLRSMTKFFAIPGLRLGYALGSEELIERLLALREPWSVNTPAQAAGVAALADGTYRERTLRLVAEERTFLSEGIAAISGLEPYPSAANYILVKMTNGFSAADLRDSLLQERILIRDCANFHGLDGRFFRAAVRTRQENLRLLTALESFPG